MNNDLTYNDFKSGKRLYQGRLSDSFSFNGREVFKVQANDFYIRADSHLLPIVGFSAEIEIYRIHDRLVLAFLSNHFYTFVEPIKVIESQTAKQFDGFEPGKEYELKNGQIWKQVNGSTIKNQLSIGNVKIIKDETMIVDTWDFHPTVKLISSRSI
jgi:hypothetical protein